MVRELLRPVPLGIYFLSFIIGVVGALVMPTFSVFLAQELNVRPLLVGIPFAGLALGSIFYNQLIGHWSDKLADRRPLVVAFCLVGTLSCAIFALSRNYWLVSASAVGLFSLAMVAYSQMLAYSLDYADKRLSANQIPLFNAIVRAQMALAWVTGPPIGFLLASEFGFSNMFWTAAALFAAVAVVSPALLPHIADNPSAINVPSGENAPGVAPRALPPQDKQSLALCLLAFSLMFGANNAYLISLPLHLGATLGLDTEWAGWLMGTCALLEIPVMLGAGFLAARLQLLGLVKLGGVAAMILYAGIYWAADLWQLFTLQILNAIFIGVFAGLGVSVVQNLLPGRSGSASAFYTNSIHVGNLFSSLLVGVVADLFGYRSVFLVNIAIIAAALTAFAGVRERHKLGDAEVRPGTNS